MMATTALLAACTEAELTDDSISTPQGDMPVNLSFFAPTPDDDATTRSTVSGTETPFTTVKMVCFASTGYFLGIREATATAWDSNHEGTLTGSVPSGTTSIHFIAGMGDVNPASLIGLQERTAMHSSTTPFFSTPTDGMRYWGYYKADNATAMATWLNNSSHKLYFVRDRAQIKMERGTTLPAAVTDIAWTVVNGLDKGFIAPYSTTGSPFVVTGDVPAPVVSTTPFSTATRFDDRTNWSALGQSQFIFDDRNETGTGKTPLIILMRAKFDGSAYKYFKVMLEDGFYRQIRVTRNHCYTLTINDLEARVGYNSVDEAIDGEFVNGFLKAVDEDVPTISYKGHHLIINEEKGTKVMFQSGTTGVVHFQFLNDDGTPVTEASASDFAAEWLEDDAIDDDVENVYSNTDIAITYNTTGNGTLTLNLNTINATLKTGKLQLVYKEGHIRYVTVYTHTPYTITNVSGGSLTSGDQGWSTTTHGSKKAHKFEFKIPSDFPADFYPITIYYTSITSEPYNDQAGSNSTTDYSKFKVIVDNTDNCRQNTGDASWNYNAKSWDYWFEYKLQSYPTDGKVIFYMDDTRVERGKSSTNYVGGFLEIPYFELDTETSGELSGYRYRYDYSNLP